VTWEEFLARMAEPNPQAGPHLDGYPECGLIDLHAGGHDYRRQAAAAVLKEPEPEAGL
jgi:hypothetical protein